jgi:thiol:disulfide interchange protein
MWFKWLLLALILLGAHIGYKKVQTYLGQQALMKTGLTIHSFQNALTLAEQQDKVVLVNVSSIWCPVCRKLDEQVFSNPKVQQLFEDTLIYSRIEYDTAEGEKFSFKYRVWGFPSLLLLNGQGEKLAQLSVEFNPETFVDNVNRSLQLIR